MSVEFNHIAAWTFTSETAVPQDVTDMLVSGEEAVAAYKTIRDQVVFTTKRLIVRGAQGFTGKKVEIYSLPYTALNMWSSENAGTFDVNAEIQLWTRAGMVKINLQRGVDMRRLDGLIAEAVLGVWVEQAGVVP